jgi:hypothetical protein
MAGEHPADALAVTLRQRLPQPPLPAPGVSCIYFSLFGSGFAGLGVCTRPLTRFQPDRFVIALIGTVFIATVFPCQGVGAQIFHAFGSCAVASLFFLQGARLFRAAVVAGAAHWRLHVAISCTTFVLFPLLGVGFCGMAPRALPQLLWSGVLFVCVLPSTVQSSIALISIARAMWRQQSAR